MTDEFKQKTKRFLKKAAMLLFNPRFLLCFGIGWIITNGWCYIGAALGAYFGIGWLTAVSTGYMALLWVPFTPEKLITLTIAIVLLRFLFPDDQKTLGLLREMYASAKKKWHDVLQKRKEKKSQKQAD